MIIFNVDAKFLSEGGKLAPDKGEFGDKGIVGELETIITSDNKYQGIEGDVSSENYSKNKNVFISELDNDGLVGYANSIGLSKEGFPIVSYHHLNAGDLKLAYCENLDCSSAKIHLLDWAGDFGYFTDLVVSNSGKVYISYLDRKNGDLRVIRCLDYKCGRAQINVIDKGAGKAGYVGEYNSIDLTKQGYPVIGYFDNNLNNLSLGSGKIKQISIAEKIDQRKIEEILLDNIFFFKKFLKEKADKYGQEILDTLIKDKKLNFPINKHTELFIAKNQKDIKKVIRYIIFRYKFLKSGKDKINLTYPPYLIIEPVSHIFFLL